MYHRPDFKIRKILHINITDWKKLRRYFINRSTILQYVSSGSVYSFFLLCFSKATLVSGATNF
mgnify:CR=1 FL=1